MYELAIVGGGPAGLSTALHLAARAPRLAARTIVVERARYPREKICAGGVGSRAITALEALGVELALGGALPAVRIDGFSVRIGDARVAIRERAAAWVVRRDTFDARLAVEVERRGVAIRQGARVRELVRDGRGVTLVCDQGSIRARAVVGADGISGVVRRAIGLGRGELRAQAVEVDTERVDGDEPADTIHFAFRPELRGYLWEFPTPLDGRVLASRGAYLLRDQRGQAADVQTPLREQLARRGLELSGHRLKQLAERGLDPAAAISASRAVLVGEAAGIDFPTGEGIAQAILQGAVAAEYLADRLARDRLDFADWRRRWLASDEGRFLRRRLFGGRALYGPLRPIVERALGRSPELFRVVLRRFAGLPIEPRLLAGAVGQLGAQLARATAHRVFAFRARRPVISAT